MSPVKTSVGDTVSTVTLKADDAALELPEKSLSVTVKTVHAVRQRGRGKAPCATGVRPRCAELRRAVKHIHRAIGLRRPGERQRSVVGDAVAHPAAVTRERQDRRNRRHSRANNRIDGLRC